jgi:hypothetical protein
MEVLWRGYGEIGEKLNPLNGWPLFEKLKLQPVAFDYISTKSDNYY